MRTDGAAVECPTCGAKFGGMIRCPWDNAKLVPLPDADPVAIAFYQAILGPNESADAAKNPNERSKLLWGDDAAAVEAALEALSGHHPERSVQEREQAMYAVVRAVRSRERERLERALHLAEHLFLMVPQDVWRDSGGDDGQGHYEGDYRAAQVQEELRAIRDGLEQ